MKKINLLKKKETATVLRNRTIDIKNPSGRSSVEKGFDDMAKLTFGDSSLRIINPSKDELDRNSDVTRSFYDIVHQEDKEKRKTILAIGIVAIIAIAAIVIVGMLINHHNEQIDGKIRVNYSASDFEGSNYEEVISQLEKQGFTNIKTNPIDDLITGWVTKDGEVKEVEIDGSSSFSSSSRFLPDVEIIITYHTFSD